MQKEEVWVHLLLHEQLLLLLLMLQSILVLHHEMLLPRVVLLHPKGPLPLPLQLPYWTPKGGADALSRQGRVSACHA